MKIQNFTVNFDDYLRYYIKKWKLLAILLLGGALLSVGATKIFGNEIVVGNSEEYIYYEQQINQNEEYMQQSILMSLDPAQLYVQTALLRNISMKAELENYVISEKIWEQFETDESKKYLSQLVQWRETTEPGVIELGLCHGTLEESQRHLEYLLNQIQQMDSEVEISRGECRVEVDQNLLETQSSAYDRLDYLKNKLEEAEAGFVIRINLLAAAIVGMLIGGCVSVVVILLMYGIKRKAN